MGRTIRRLFRVAPEEVSMELRGFRGEPALEQRLEGVARTFLDGYHLALAEDGGPERLAAGIDGSIGERWLRGFAYEGAAFGLALRDLLSPRRRLPRFLDAAGEAYVHLLHVGAGWTIAKPGVPPRWLMRRLDPRFAWLAVDGYGFQQGFFRHPLRVVRQRVPRRLRGYARRAFDHGLGRSLWFSEVADAERLGRRVTAFPAARRNDLWSGVGLAAGYAGGVGEPALVRLAEAAGEHRPALAQGAAFAAKARALEGTPTPEAERAARVLCGCPALEAAAVTDRALEGLPTDRAGFESWQGGEPAFEFWRRRIQSELAGALAAA